MCYNVKYLKRALILEKIEDKIIKTIEKRNIHNKNYFWIVSILIFSIIIIIYSYQTNTGIIAKQTINKELVVKNQENLKQLYKENKAQTDLVTPVEEPFFVETKEIKDIIAEEKNTTILEEETSSQDKDAMVVQENVSESNISVPKEKPAQKIAIIEKEEVQIQTVVEPIEKIQTPKTQETILQKTVEKEIKAASLDNSQTSLTKVIEPKTPFNLIYCYNFEPAKYTFTSSCQKQLEEFIQKNSKALRYEIIGLIDVEDVKNLNNKGEINQGVLAKNRIISVQEFLKNKTQVPLSDHFYYLKSELPMRGFVLRAYF